MIIDDGSQTAVSVSASSLPDDGDMSNTYGSYTTDVVAVFDENYNQLFPLARAIKLSVNRDAALMSRPTEKGSIFTDFRIILPVEMELQLFIPTGYSADTYSLIESLFEGNTLCYVSTRLKVFSNLAVLGIPHEENTDMADTVLLAFRVREVLIINTQYQALPPTAVATPTDQSTVDRGEQQPASGSILGSLTSSFAKRN